ncbi:DNA polymerase epsilon subunit 2-like [Centruroides sculpturatus]|uniref:DNA polymerase epsilon subunit 2-like n=1 Tax=Centruroides sculpturatus TaxID=218467 RepID=UPI000C6D075D|nr:DNA polymerase epsilon subunit 2-like [Centruroides sculpturatus]
MALNVRSRVLKFFQLNGLILRSEASKYLTEFLKDFEEKDILKCLEKIITIIQRQPLDAEFVTKELVELAIKECSDIDEDGQKDYFSVIDAFSFPAFIYDSEKKKFFPRSTSNGPKLYGDADSKSSIFIERYKLIHQRTISHQLFMAPVFENNGSSHSQSFSLKSVEYLLGTTAKQGNLLVLGMLTQLKEVSHFLEDFSVHIDINKYIYKGGLFTENCFVLAEGYCEDSIFHVSALGFPPPETSQTTLKRFECLNLCGNISANKFIKLKALEKNHQDAMFVFLSDVWLDKIQVMQKLRVLFAGYSEMPPTCFVFMGNFLSTHAGYSHFQTTKDGFKKLASLISEFPRLVENSYFVFIPGPNDPVLSHILPRPAIPNTFLDDFLKKVPKAVFTTNPCRIRFYTQNILIFREDLIAKMCRNSVYFPWEHENDIDIPTLFAKTLVANAHLSPLPLVVQPIYWEWDFALCLYPLPDVIVCGDKYDPYCVTNTDCIFFNPGSFPRSNFSFKVYLPGSKQVEDSQITETD